MSTVVPLNSGHTLAMRPAKLKPTPKGEAGTSLQYTKELLLLIEDCSGPDQTEAFVGRLNDFLRSAHTVVEFLQKESRQRPGLKNWLKDELNKLHPDARYWYFDRLRNVSEHDCMVRPDRGQVSVEMTAQLRMSGFLEAELRDAKTGEVEVRVSSSAPPGVESLSESTKVSVKYFFVEWPQQDILSFCRRIVETLSSLVNGAYKNCP